MNEKIAIENNCLFNGRDIKSNRTKYYEARHDPVLFLHPFHLETMFTRLESTKMKPCQTTITLCGEWRLTKNKLFCGEIKVHNEDIGFMTLRCKFFKRQNNLECHQIVIIESKSLI